MPDNKSTSLTQWVPFCLMIRGENHNYTRVKQGMEWTMPTIPLPRDYLVDRKPPPRDSERDSLAASISSSSPRWRKGRRQFKIDTLFGNCLLLLHAIRNRRERESLPLCVCVCLRYLDAFGYSERIALAVGPCPIVVHFLHSIDLHPTTFSWFVRWNIPWSRYSWLLRGRNSSSSFQL